MKRLGVVRVRGSVNVNRDIKEALRMLRLSRVNYCTLIDDRESYIGTLRKVKDYVTWGEVGTDDVALILKNRGELSGGKRLTEGHLKENTKFKSLEDFAKSFVKFEAELDDIPSLKPFFRLHPPRKGHGGIKRAYVEGGALGKRDNMKDILYRMR
ncbi:50S ribosomal protein L30 [archaeon]|nr:50S ribosomal protein L30 [archaeon]